MAHFELNPAQGSLNSEFFNPYIKKHVFTKNQIFGFGSFRFTNGSFTNPLLESGPDPWTIYHEGNYFYIKSDTRALTLMRTPDITDLKNPEKKVIGTARKTGYPTTLMTRPSMVVATNVRPGPKKLAGRQRICLFWANPIPTLKRLEKPSGDEKRRSRITASIFFSNDAVFDTYCWTIER